ncbi:hypothetical protein BCR33DRAFT_797124 [Rhizoclosmatium globosum]|uniref:Uncharacterized protein n=1 Tax=Rhizoclosmatium globosum TaxID=329046 RepID=A0A1Y2AJ05_9FUNG|nr:hypothetical protein BCR33DRAFT_797124 [Rhizoclosmatium globosum]|eukprot:ORY22452.1 hypothetical protein BCR33DRAFT_797124 [Rhizoclosmatium globosum]
MLILPSIILCSIATSISILLIFYIIYFIVVYEFLLVSKDFTWKAFASLFNVLIITGNFASAGFSISIGTQRFYAEVGSPLSKAMGILSGFMFALLQYCYLRYTWARGSDIVRRQFKFVFSGMRLFLKLVPVLLMAECAATALYSLEPLSTRYVPIYFGIHGVTGFVIVVFDGVMLGSFIQFLRTTHLEDEPALKDFLMICWYGIGSTILCFFMVAVFVGVATVKKLEVINFMFSIITLLMSLVFLMLSLMKIRVIHQSRASSARSASMATTKQPLTKTNNAP